MATEIGLSDFHYAIIESDTKSELVYRAPVSIVNLITAGITPNIVESVLSADNGPAESHSALSKIDVEIELAALTLKKQAELLGHTFADGGIIKKGSDVAPYVAIGFKSLKSNGKYRYVWLKKGKFSEPTRSHKTQGEQVEYNTAKIKASFVLTAYDNSWEASIDEDEDDFDPADATTWFTDTTLDVGLGGTASNTLEALSFSCVAGTSSGTKITSVSPVLGGGNSYMYKINGTLPALNEDLDGKGWTVYTLNTDIATTAGNTIALVEVVTGNIAKKGGTASAVTD